MADAEGDRVQQLCQRQPERIRGQCQHAPAQQTTSGTNQKQGLVTDTGEQATAQGKHQDLRQHAKRPQIADDIFRIAMGLPVEGAEAVIGGMAALQQTHHQQEHHEGAIAQQGGKADAPPTGWRIDRCRRHRQPAQTAQQQQAQHHGVQHPARPPVLHQGPHQGRAENEGRRTPQPHLAVIKLHLQHHARRQCLTQR